MKTSTLTLCLTLLAGSLALPLTARATLGEGAASVVRDRHALSASQSGVTDHASYTVQEVVSEGATIREYLNSAGVVFAIAWDGLTHPDLTTLLGSYGPEYQDAKGRTPRKFGERRSKVASGRVTVETWGHMRNLQGRAYLPSLIPEGVSVDEIK